MSIIHVNQIKSHIAKLFTGHVDLSDVHAASAEMQTNFILTRSLAAYAIQYLSGSSVEDSAAAITDGGNDNGIDALFYDQANKRLYLVQSKWSHSGSGEPENGDIKKFLAGVRDLFNMQFDRFNAKVQSKASDVTLALNDPLTRYDIVVAYTGASNLSTPSARDLEDLKVEMNDTSEVVFVTTLNQAALHRTLVANTAGAPISLEVALKSWGKKEGPHEAYYGQVAAVDIAEWWATYRSRLFDRNLRGVLGDTDVNTEMRNTLANRPEDFWYFNNGVTVVAKSAQRAMAGGAAHDYARFHCDDVSVVNGAQTVSTIGHFAESEGAAIANVLVPIRIIVRGENETFGNDVTRTNNRQNRIENRDFVTLDQEQVRLRQELAIDGINYQLARNAGSVRSETSFDLVEATTALSCASLKARLVVQLKREIGVLWADLAKAPYRELFNPSVAGQTVWRSVQIQRRIDVALETRPKRGGSPHSKRHAVGIHGNRMVSMLVFARLPTAAIHDPGKALEEFAGETLLTKSVDEELERLLDQLDKHYSNAIIPTLFKNLGKCEHIAKLLRSS